MAFDVYDVAFKTTDDWYVGINAATLALLVGNREMAVEYAGTVAKKCEVLLKKMKDNRTASQDRQLKKDRYWLYATEGEAALIMNKDAMMFYKAALGELSPGLYGMANSSYKQVCRLHTVLKNNHVEDVLRLFETSAASDHLTNPFLGRTFTKVVS